MRSDGPKRLEKTWEELATAASMETDPEKLATILEEILLLTKMNWNTTAFADLRPITLRFSQLVGDIMREIPANREPLPQFKFYM